MNEKTEEYLVERIRVLEGENQRLEREAGIGQSITQFLDKRLDEVKEEKEALEHKLEEADMEVMECRKNTATLLSFIVDTLELDIGIGTGFINKSVVDIEEIPEIVKKAFEAKEAKRRQEKDGTRKND